MKFLYTILILFSTLGFSQDYVFFSDSPNNTYYDPSFGFNQNGSTVIMVNGTKFPVDVNYKYSGVNGLRFNVEICFGW